MPNAIEFHIGDTVTHSLLGDGLILDSRVDPIKGSPVYHVYFPATDTFRYSHTKNLELIKLADDVTTNDAQTKLLSLHKPKSSSSTYQFGDVVNTAVGTVIVLDNGRIDTRGRTYYHVCRQSDHAFYYMQAIDILSRITCSSTDSRKEAQKILRDEIITPAFTANP